MEGEGGVGRGDGGRKERTMFSRENRAAEILVFLSRRRKGAVTLENSLEVYGKVNETFIIYPINPNLLKRNGYTVYVNVRVSSCKRHNLL